MRGLTACLSASVVLLGQAAAMPAGDLEVPAQKISASEPAGMMCRYSAQQLGRALDRWKANYEKLKTTEEIAAYQKRLREDLLQSIGGLPERTPLDAQVKGVVARPGYHVEKIIFQSQPKHYVTALLFLPDRERFSPPYPGVIVPCGHVMEGKAWGEYQSMGALLALNGMAALVFDPIDQGERGQYLGEGGWPKLASVEGHCMVGMGCVLLGRNTARFEIWDGMRAIDYLQSRPEVDARRIGCTGNSGGGTQASYLMALDDRISAAAVSCYISSLSRVVGEIGAQDSEQVLFGQLAFGDHADWLMMRAPSPVLICAATHDFFPIGGAWDTFRYAKRLFTRMGFAERVGILENDAGHNYNKLQREGVARWMSRWLLGKDVPIIEPPITLLSQQEYQCLPDGKVMSLPGARSVYDLNEDYEKELANRRKSAWAAGDRTTLLARVRQLSGIRELAALPKPEVEKVGTVDRNGYRIEKLVLRAEDAIALPALLFLPENADPKRAVLYVHEKGKAADAGPGGPIEQLVQGGHTVLAVDLRGTGQTQSTSPGWDSPEFQDAHLAYMLGRSYLGQRAEDLLISARYLMERVAGDRAIPMNLVAVGSVGPAALHAAALEPDRFSAVMLSRSLASWSNVIHSRLHSGVVVNMVHGALTHYDLPDLVASLGEKITIKEPVNALGVVIEEAK